MNKIVIVAIAAALTAGAANAKGWGHGHRGEGRGMGANFMEQFDINGDGGITQEEIDAVRSGRLAEFDTNDDGALSIEEYEALWLDAMRERMVDMFQRHDDDGDGIVTAEEFSEDFSGIVARRDTNGDGILNADDMRERMHRRGGDRQRRGGSDGQDAN